METQKTELTVDQKNDQMIKALFNQVKALKAQVASLDRPTFITGGQFRYSESVGASLDIPTIRDIRKLKEIYMFLLERSSHNEKANEFFGVTEPFTWLTFTPEEWSADLKTRANILQSAKLKAKLIDYEARLDKILTPALRAQMEIDSISAELAELG